MSPKVGRLGLDPNMRSPFKASIVLKAKDEEIVAKSRLVPMLHQ